MQVRDGNDDDLVVPHLIDDRVRESMELMLPRAGGSTAARREEIRLCAAPLNRIRPKARPRDPPLWHRTIQQLPQAPPQPRFRSAISCSVWEPGSQARHGLFEW